MSQLPLGIHYKYNYKADRFYWHYGLLDLKQQLDLLSSNQKFLAFIQGRSRFGKSHLALALGDWAHKQNLYPRLIHSADHFIKYVTQMSSDSICAEDCFVLDDFDRYDLSDSQRGIFVDFYNQVSAVNAKLILLANESFEVQDLDPHLKSRIDSMLKFRIGNPAHEDLAFLIDLYFKQRGLSIGDSLAKFLASRLPRNLCELEKIIDHVVQRKQQDSLPLNRATLTNLT